MNSNPFGSPRAPMPFITVIDGITSSLFAAVWHTEPILTVVHDSTNASARLDGAHLRTGTHLLGAGCGLHQYESDQLSAGGKVEIGDASVLLLLR